MPYVNETDYHINIAFYKLVYESDFRLSDNEVIKK